MVCLYPRVLLSLTLAMWIPATALYADTVYLENGDILSGAVQEIREGLVVLLTDYAGEVIIQQEAVRAVQTDEGVAVRMANGDVIEGRLEQGDAGQYIATEADTRPLAWAAIEALPPDAVALEEETKERRWTGGVDAAASLRSGNTDTMDLNLGAEVIRRGERNVLTLNMLAAYGESEDVLNTRRYQGRGKWQFYPRDRLYLFGLLAAEHDAGRKLDFRTEAGIGAGYDFIEQERRKLSGDLGVTFNYERWNPFTPWQRDNAKNARRATALAQLDAWFTNLGATLALPSVASLSNLTGIIGDIDDPLRDDETRTEEYVNLRASAHFEQKLFDASLISEEITLLPNLEDFGEFRFTSELTFSTPISEALSLRAQLKTEYDSRADESGVDAWDNALLVGLRYDF